MNTTDEFWDIDGVSLNTLAWNIETLGGGRLRVPSVRGENIEIDGRPGSIWVPKVSGPQLITLGMWVKDSNADGTIPAHGSQRRAYNENWEALVALLFRPWELLSLTKRWYTQGILRSAIGLAEYVSGLEPAMIDPSSAKFTVDLNIPETYFFGPLESHPVDTVSVGAPATVTVNNKGQDMLYDMSISLPAGSTLTNSTLGISVTNNGAATATLDVLDFQVSGVNPGDITSTDDYWMALKPGDNAMTGNATIDFKPNYF